MTRPSLFPDDSQGARTVALSDLLGEARQIYIQHEDRRYVLRLTRQNKLILTRDESDRTQRRQEAAE